MSGGRIAARIGAYVRRHHLALLALFVALGGTAVAASHHTAPKNSVIGKSIRKGAVTRPKLAPNSVDGSKVKDHSLTGADIDLGSLGTVPQAANAAGLGGAAAGAYVKGASQIPAGGDLAGTYDQPLVRVGRETLVPGPVAVPIGPGPEFSVTIDAPASGLIEVMAWARLSAGSSSVTFATLRNDGAFVDQLLSVTATTKALYSRQESGFTGTENPASAQWIPVFTTPGRHTIGLQFEGAGSSGHSAENIHLLVRAFS